MTSNHHPEVAETAPDERCDEARDIEITDEMIEAGARVAAQMDGENFAAVAAEVFKAMVLAAQ